ncbi:MAG: MlaE family lipid ABC transporter permease subunit [Thermodesulfobacteriota bacterium]
MTEGSHSHVGQKESPKSYKITADTAGFDKLIVRVSGIVSWDNSTDVRDEVIAILKTDPLKNVVLDLGGVGYFDSGGTACLLELESQVLKAHNTLEVRNVPAGFERFVDLRGLTRPEKTGVLRPRTDPNLLEQIGDGTLHLVDSARDILAFIGASLAALVEDLARPGKLHWGSLWKLVERSGADAVPIVTMLSFLTGCIVAFQGAIQLRKFGADIFVADMVSLSTCLEMGPLIASLIVCGRSGAAFAAEIGTMQVNEEIDALRVMAIDPLKYLVSPRIIAVAFVLPCLTLLADLMGILAGCAVGALTLDITPAAYFNQVRKVLALSDVAKGLSKSFVFGIEIAMIGCFKGLEVKGGAESVGKATTSAVVTTIFILTVTNALFSMLFYYVTFI